MNTNLLASYLVELGFEIRSNEFKQFEQTLKSASSTVESYTGGMFADLLKWQAGITTFFGGLAAGFVGLADHVAMADQDFRLYALQLQTTLDTARQLKIAQDALGEPISIISWDPELRSRFIALQADQLKYQGRLGVSFEGQMRAIRDLRFELTRLQVAGQYFAQILVSRVFAQFGTSIEAIQKKLEAWLGYIQQHMPEIAEAFATYVVPFLKTTWELAVETGTAFADMGTLFTNVVGLLSGDHAIEGTTFKFQNFGNALQHVVNWLGDFVRMMLFGEEALAHMGNEISLFLSGKFSEAAQEDKILGQYMSADFRKSFESQFGAGSSASKGPGRQQSSTADASERASHAYQLALRAGVETGIDPSLIFEDWAHETNNFSSRVARDLNNLGGIRQGLSYRSFDSLEAFEQFYVNLLRSPRYSRQGIASATNPEEFASALKRGGYYEDTYENYVNGMKRFAGEYASMGGAGRGGAGGSQIGSVDQRVTMGDIHVHIPPGTNGDPQQIAQVTRDQVRQELARRDQLALAQLQGAY